MSNITELLTVDPPLILSADYLLGTRDRQFISSQILGLQAHMVRNLRGQTVTWVKLHAGSEPVSVGFVVCGALAVAVETDPLLAERYATLATPEALALAGIALGIALTAANPGGWLLIATDGIVGPSVTGIPVDVVSKPVRVNNWRASTTDALEVGDYPLGHADPLGNLTLARSRAVSGGAAVVPLTFSRFVSLHGPIGEQDGSISRPYNAMELAVVQAELISQGGSNWVNLLVDPGFYNGGYGSPVDVAWLVPRSPPRGLTVTALGAGVYLPVFNTDFLGGDLMIVGCYVPAIVHTANVTLRHCALYNAEHAIGGTEVTLLGCTIVDGGTVELEFTGAPGTLYLDEASNYYWVASGSTLINGTKVVLNGAGAGGGATMGRLSVEADTVGLWHFDGNLADASAGARTLTAWSGSARYSYMWPGHRSLQRFTDRVVEVTPSAALRLQGAMTVELVLTQPGTNYPTINAVLGCFSDTTGTAAVNRAFFLEINSNGFAVRWTSQSGDFVTATHSLSDTQIGVARGVPSHVAVTRAADGVVQIYVDGLPAGAASAVLPLPDGGASCDFGLFGATATETLLTELRISNTARTAEQIKAARNTILGPAFGVIP